MNITSLNNPTNLLLFTLNDNSKVGEIVQLKDIVEKSNHNYDKDNMFNIILPYLRTNGFIKCYMKSREIDGITIELTTKGQYQYNVLKDLGVNFEKNLEVTY